MAARKKSASRARARGKTAAARPKRAAKRRPAAKKTARRAAVKRAAPKRTRSAAPKRVKTPARSAATARPPRRMAAPANAIGMRVQHMDYTSHSMDEVKRFYTEWLGFSQFEYDAGMQYLRVVTGTSSSLGFMPPMPGPPEQWRPPREPHIYLIVDDVDRAYRDLIEKGVTFEQAPADMPWGHRVAVARDPEGRAVCLAEIRNR